MSDFRRDIEKAINRHSRENNSNTPDYILAHFLMVCLAAFDIAVKDRDEWYGFNPWVKPTSKKEAVPDDHTR